MNLKNIGNVFYQTFRCNSGGSPVRALPKAGQTFIDQVPHPKSVPPSLQLLAGYREYLDQLSKKSSEIESSLDELQKTHQLKKEAFKEAKKRGLELLPNVGWMETTAIEQLFEQSEQHKREMRNSLQDLQDIIDDAAKVHQNLVENGVKPFAVDGPDGEPDYARVADHLVVDWILEDHAAIADRNSKPASVSADVDLNLKVYRDPTEWYQRMMQSGPPSFAVDAPSGEPDYMHATDHAAVDWILKDHAANASAKQASP
jgi:hypothetical protein